jgi:hypothetical protein
LWYRDVGFLKGGAVALLMVFTAQGAAGSIAWGQTLIIPTLSVSETYDSNVFYTPKSLLDPTFKPEDFVTTITPQVNLAHTGPLIRGSMSVGASITKYLHNPDLDYTGINAAGTLDLRSLANKVSPRLTTLSVTGSYQFTPSLSAFGATNGGLGTGYGTTGQIGPLNSGLITNRVSMHTYDLAINGAYQLTPNTSLAGGYNYTQLSFGNQSGGVDNALFDTIGHQGTATITTLLSQRDSVGTTAMLAHYSQGEGATSTFTTVSGMMNWNRRWTQQVSSTLSGGGILTLPIESAIPGQSVKAQLAPTGTVTLNYTSFSQGLRDAGSRRGPFDGLPSLSGMLNPGGILGPGQYTASLSYNFSIFPSYGFGAGPIKTHVVGLNAAGGITSKLSGQAGLNFSHGTSSAPLTSFDTIGLTTGLRYLIGPVFANLTYSWLYFSSSFPQQGIGDSEYSFSKKMVMLSLSYAFTSQSFFRMDRFGYAEVGTKGPAEGSPGTSPAGPDIPRKE